MCLDIYRLDPVYFVSAPGLAWQACLKKTEVKLELLTDYDKNSESSYIEYLDANNLYEWTMSQKRPTNGFRWVEDLSQFNEDFMKKYDENSYI